MLINVLDPLVGGIAAVGSIGAGSFSLGADSSFPGTSATLQYDGTTSDVFVPTNSLSNAHGLNTDLTAGGVNNGIRVDFGFLNANGAATTVNVTINATSAGGTATYSVNLAQDATPFDTFAAFSGFNTTGAFTWSDITSLNFVINSPGVAGVDVSISSIVAADQTSAGHNFANFSLPASVSGNVYVDENNSGIITATDPPIGGVIVTLTGTNDLGTSVTMTTTTSAAGTYSFTGLRPGAYTVTETQPVNFIDGKTTAGTLNGVTDGTASDNVIAGIVLPADGASVSNNFGELGLAPAYVSKRSFLYPLPAVVLTAVYPAGGAAGPAVMLLAAASSGSSGSASGAATSGVSSSLATNSALGGGAASAGSSAGVSAASATSPTAASVTPPISSTLLVSSPLTAASLGGTSAGSTVTSGSAGSNSSLSASSSATTTTGSAAAGAGSSASAAASASGMTVELKKTLLGSD